MIISFYVEHLFQVQSHVVSKLTCEQIDGKLTLIVYSLWSSWDLSLIREVPCPLTAPHPVLRLVIAPLLGTFEVLGMCSKMGKRSGYSGDVREKVRGNYI